MWEANLLQELLVLLEGMLVIENRFSSMEEKVLRYMWRSPALSKLITFSWQLLHD